MNNYDNGDVPSILLPCVSCNRTFRPEALAKHSKVCEKTLMKKRKKFDSSKQRIQGTDLAEFLPVLPTFTKKVDKSPVRKIQPPTSCATLSSSSKTSLTSPKSKWREKHNELVQTIAAARLPPGQAPSPPVKLTGHEPCPYCERTFGPKAYDRHLEWCREKRTRIQPKSPASQRAKERLEARTKYQAPLTNKIKQRSASRDKQPGGRETSPQPQHTSHTPASLRRKPTKTNVLESMSTPNINQNFVKGGTLRSSTRSVSSVKRPQQLASEPESYDPYKSAERQMLELLEPEKNAPKLAPISPVPKSPAILSSPTSAFTKFSPIQSPSPLFISEDDNSNLTSKSSKSSENSDSPLTVTSPYDNFVSSKDSNQNPISLSTLSLCSTISIESVDSIKNGNRMGLSSSARVPEKKTPVPLRRTASAFESRRTRDPLKGKLKMEDMLYGTTNNEKERYFGSPIITGELEKGNDNHSSSGSLYKTVSDAETLNAEQELLKSMSEFEKLLSSSSSSPSPSSPPLKLFPSLVSSFPLDDMDKLESDLHISSHVGGPDSAYSSLNRKSPVDGKQERHSSMSEAVARFSYCVVINDSCDVAALTASPRWMASRRETSQCPRRSLGSHIVLLSMIPVMLQP
ncbi:uncharacterized protein LOC124361960 isoform X10 [Homalodisca vitripennis]|uniref:uncharacterized protein LOC124361960 isoform X10 n=1 Tax=Homalodisca vitripennis TaxID=197043 RepID=UPI001EEBBAB5|nr:uncharacterized protein LOC124361960 isoform X10 [Homalodisca vitripennis]